MTAKYHIMQAVQHYSGNIPGVICDVAGPSTFVKEYWYEVQWTDGNVDIYPESQLTPMKAANDDEYETVPA